MAMKTIRNLLFVSLVGLFLTVAPRTARAEDCAGYDSGSCGRAQCECNAMAGQPAWTHGPACGETGWEDSHCCIQGQCFSMICWPQVTSCMQPTYGTCNGAQCNQG